MNYKVVVDENEFNKFLQWFPLLEGDTLIPIPGTYQGRFFPQLFDMKYFI